ncbi:hypothetical protein SARC_13253 [Sphaeroforma arctica JP610]|uniref:Uncharacterized protein n=1 Tax=Sphaeroforma arctica JP610 TaxID=667725 RepID=A0A0L0FDQ6_9EUKA|nr:hypothetical protein SARC_13253 [Sphaeroforma arctica JP610]KNC74193.1 hypothetical protein SARC_13253 [Sphaeroforma arctica JP610]|eukprot:XP_014148095.1 hypothetical protein SARC_13253 [Sphaeroforma arctica JP610]
MNTARKYVQSTSQFVCDSKALVGQRLGDTLAPSQSKLKRHANKNYKDFLQYWQPDHDWDTYENQMNIPHETTIQILPQDIFKYGRENPGPDDHPTLRRESGLGFLKKSISYYMPLIANDWDPVDMKGNPTRSKDVNDLLKTIKRAELRGEGKADAAKRLIEYDEFRQILAINLENKNFHNSVDDVTNIKFEDLMPNDDNPEQLFVTLVHSKNLREKGQVATQVKLGSMNSYFCALSALAAHLVERMLERTNTHQLDLGNMWTLNGTVGWDDMLNPDVAMRVIAKIVRLDNFVAKGKVDEIGTHSLRRCSCIYAQRRGRSKDDAEGRGRWSRTRTKGQRKKKSNRPVDRYSSPLIPYPDAKVSEALCGPRGACNYRINSSKL